MPVKTDLEVPPRASVFNFSGRFGSITCYNGAPVFEMAAANTGGVGEVGDVQRFIAVDQLTVRFGQRLDGGFTFSAQHNQLRIIWRIFDVLSVRVATSREEVEA